MARRGGAVGPLANRSLTKYKLIIDEFGGWPLFQELLAALRRVADRHGVDVATVAGAAVLSRPGVAAVIVGATSRAHLSANAAVAAIRLTAADHAEIGAITRGASVREAMFMSSSAIAAAGTARS